MIQCYYFIGKPIPIFEKYSLWPNSSLTTQARQSGHGRKAEIGAQ